MTRFRIAFVLVALVVITGSARAQRWGGGDSRGSGGHASPSSNRQAAPPAWNGTVSKWGGSPAESREHRHQFSGYLMPLDAYIPDAVAAPAPVPPTYYVDTVYAPSRAAPVQMPVVTSEREAPTPTTMDVYRQQARFRKP